jgi:hypothetical protein
MPHTLTRRNENSPAACSHAPRANLNTTLASPGRHPMDSASSKESQLKRKSVAVRGWQYVTMLVLVLQSIHSVADTGVPPQRPASELTSAASPASASNHADRPVTGHEAMWGVVGIPAAPVLDLVNASPLMLSELNDYQDAVDAHTAVPFGDLQEDWSGAKMLMVPPGIRQIAISSDVLTEPATDFVGELSHGLGYFRNYEKDRRLINAARQAHLDEAGMRVRMGTAGVQMETRAEVNNYLVQQQIIDATRSRPQGPVVIKLTNSERSNGLLQWAFDQRSASTHKAGLTPEQNQEQLELAGYAITASIPIPQRSAPSPKREDPLAGDQGDLSTIPLTDSAHHERSASIHDFIRRLRSVADSGSLNDVAKTMNLLDMTYHANTVQMAASPPDCSIDWHPRSQLTTNVQQVGSDWYVPTQFGVQNLSVPAVFINPATTITGNPAVRYSVTRTIRCTDSFRLQDNTEATLDLDPLPPFLCLTKPDIAAALPRSYPENATDGVSFFRYQGHLDDDTGTTLSFFFRAGARCALSATIRQSQESGLRVQRAASKFQACSADATQMLCSSHEAVGWKDKTLDEREQYISQRCGTLNALYLKEPLSGEPPPPPPPPSVSNRTPCG